MAKDIIDFIKGEDTITGDKINRWLLGAMIFTPEAVDMAIKKGAKNGDEVLGFIKKSKDADNLRYVLKNTDIDLRGTGTKFDDALDMAFQKTGFNKVDFEVTKWGKNKYGKSFPVEWRASNGAEVSVDFAHYNIDANGNWITGPDAPHIGWQTGGKRSNGGATRGHIIVDEVPYGR